MDNTIFQTICKNLPVGLEIYDCNGTLIELNPMSVKMRGIQTQDELSGYNLFEDPNFTEEIKIRIQSEEEVHYTSEYNFDKVRGEHYPTSLFGTYYFKITINSIKDTNGKINQYILFLQNITEHTLLQKEHESLHNQNYTILESLPVGIELYSNEGEILYLNNADCHIFGAPKEEALLRKINIHQNPNLPKEIKAAARNGSKIHTHFPYNFDKINENNYYSSSFTNLTRQIECNGTPILNAKGEMENYVFIINDVTDAVQAAESLRQSKRKTELAMKDADIMLWEFNSQTCLFTSENEPMNGYNTSKPIPLENYITSIHPDDRTQATEIIQDMLAGKDQPFHFEARVKLPNDPEWQYCAISGSPYEKRSDGKIIRYVGFRKNNTDLQKKKALLENILNNIPLPIHIKDVEDNFRYVFCNQESKKMFGSNEKRTAYDVMSQKQADKMHETDMEVFHTGNPYLGKEKIVLSDGRSYETIVQKSIIYDNNKRLLLNIRWDKSLQNELERRAKVLSISVDALNAYTWFYDSLEGTLTYGDGFEKTGGDPLLIDTPQKFAKHIHPDDRKRYFDAIHSSLEKENGDFSVEYRIDFFGNDTYEWWECRGVVETTIRNNAPFKYMLGMDINIESHKRTELTLLENKNELNKLIQQNELVLNNTNSGLAYIDTNYIVQWENVSICNTSLSYEAYKKGEPCYKSAHNRTSPCENCVLQRALSSCQMEQIHFNLDNQKTVEITATPVFNTRKEIDGIVIRVDDITERQQMINELRKAKQLAEQSDKLKSAFLANMSHEIRTPLNAIVGFSELLMYATEEEEREEYTSIIQTNNELLLKLINDILDLSKIEAGSVELKYEEFDLSAYFKEMHASMQQRVTNPNVKLLLTDPYDSCFIQSDKNRIAQILTNYVTNAIKYTPKGFIEMGYKQVEEGIRLYVKDTGIGIAEDKKNKVFHRFEKLDEFAQGTGLGLSICKAICEAFGGNVGFESEFGQGSYFWAFIPCKARTTPTEEESISTTENGTQDFLSTDLPLRKTILVVEDIQSNYLLVSALLRKEYDLLHALNGQEAIDMVRTESVDLVLMDMKMPLMDGLTATTEIRKFNKKIPIIALTAHAFETDKIAAFEAGCNDYLIKPIDKVLLKEVLEKY